MHTFILLGRCQAAEESEEARTVSELSPTATTHTALPGCEGGSGPCENYGTAMIHFILSTEP
jgi:hypothetical protein